VLLVLLRRLGYVAAPVFELIVALLFCDASLLHMGLLFVLGANACHGVLGETPSLRPCFVVLSSCGHVLRQVDACLSSLSVCRTDLDLSHMEIGSLGRQLSFEGIGGWVGRTYIHDRVLGRAGVFEKHFGLVVHVGTSR
jgi:hypothetical protein